MTFIPINFDDAVEPQPVPAGRYNVQITGAQVKMTGEKSKHPNKPQIVVTIGLPDNPDAPTFQQYLSIPHEEDEPKSVNFKALLLKRFFALFNVPFDNSGIDLEQICFALQGATANAELKLESSPNNSEVVFNTLVVPRLRGEASSAGGRSSQKN